MIGAGAEQQLVSQQLDFANKPRIRSKMLGFSKQSLEQPQPQLEASGATLLTWGWAAGWSLLRGVGPGADRRRQQQENDIHGGNPPMVRDVGGRLSCPRGHSLRETDVRRHPDA